MKIVVMGKSGNTGKSTMSEHLADQMVLSVEKLNSNNHKGKGIRGNNVDEIVTSLIIEPEITVDVGASEYERFLNMLISTDGAHLDVDRFVLPVTPKRKQMEDVAGTAIDLIELGVDASKIKVIFNMVDEETFEEDFNQYIAMLKKMGVETRVDCYLPKTDLFDKLEDANQTIHEAMADTTDYRKLAREAEAREEKIKYAQWSILGGMATSINRNLDKIRAYVEA